MNYSPKSPAKHPDRISDPFAGSEVMSVTQPGNADLADWVELMEAVEALCPVWPAAQRSMGGRYRL